MRKADEIRKILKDNKISGYRLEQDLGISQVGADKFLNGETKKPYKSTLNLYNSYINNGFKVIEEPPAKYEVNAIQVSADELHVMNVPLVSKYAYAGYLSGFGDNEYVGELPTIPWANDRQNKGKYMTFEVKGDSMEPRYLEGDLLLCREVRNDLWSSKLHINKWDFIIVHKEEGILLKRIIQHDTSNGKITCRSLNDYYEDFELNLKDVQQLFNVVDLKRSMSRR